MAKLSASKALEDYKLGIYENISKQLSDETTRRSNRRNQVYLKEQDEDEQPTPSDILKEYKARVEMEEIQEKELERADKGMSRLEFKDYEKSIKTGQATAKTLFSEKRTLGRTIATEKRAADRAEIKVIAEKSEAEKEEKAKKAEIQDKIAKGEGGFIQSQIEGIYPQGITSFSKAEDINILTDKLDAGDRSKQKAFFTIDDILFMVKNKEFENAGFTQASIIDRLGIEDGESTNTLQELQQFMFEFLQTPHGQNIANSQKMEYKTAAETKLDMLEMYMKGGFNMDNDGLPGPRQD